MFRTTTTTFAAIASLSVATMGGTQRLPHETAASTEEVVSEISSGDVAGGESRRARNGTPSR